MCIGFDLSFFVGGLSEKFTANFIDQIINQAVPPWGTYQEFCTGCENTFPDTNKKTNVENQLMLLKQGTKTAEEFFQEFNQLAFAAGYTNTYHDDILIKLLHEAIHIHTINLIYAQPALPKVCHRHTVGLVYF